VGAEDLIEKMGALKVKEGRGLIGALAAISWPRIERTFELICYRDPRRWGTKRAIDEGTVKRIELEFPETFDSFDLESSVQRIAPSSPCPVLYGIRGIKPDALKEAKKVLRGEEGEGWMIFESNQGTDDHLQMRKIGEIEEIQSVIVDGLVSSPPWRIRGGHLFFEISDDSGRIECAAFEPTKRFREVLSRLEVGDRIRAYGGVKKSTINLEKIEIIETVPIYEREDPSCPRCARRMKSMGTGKGYRCRCGWRVGEAFALLSKRRRPEPGFYEVPIRARKHLSKPIKLMVS
jgi:tRNA(Ile2)-agmatinylcytidine synthase